MKYRTIAAYKALVKGDSSAYQDIINKTTDLSACKGIALSDSSLEESDRMHVRLNKDQGRGRKQSGNSEALDSIRSTNDYWQDLEDKKRERYFTKQGKIEREEAGRSKSRGGGNAN